MSTKEQLADLYGHYKLPANKYKQLLSFLDLEHNTELIQKLEQYELPEITKLICCSDFLLSQKWADKYKCIKNFYRQLEDIKIDDIISDCQSKEVLEKKILIFADSQIIDMFKNHFDNLIKKREEAEKEKKRKKQANNDEYNKLDNYLKNNKDYIELINEYATKIKNTKLNKVRETVYLMLDEYDMKRTDEEEFLNEFIKTKEIASNYYLKLSTKDFLDNVLSILDKKYNGYEIPTLIALHDKKVINLTDNSIKTFIESHPEILSQYLCKNIPQNINITELNDTVLGLLLKIALDKEVKNIKEKEKCYFIKVWNKIGNEEAWLWIFKKISELDTDISVNDKIVHFIDYLNGVASKSFAKMIFNNLLSSESIEMDKIIRKLLKSKSYNNKNFILEYIDFLEKNNKKYQKKLNKANRRLKSHQQEIFTALYLPIEKLEELAISLKLTDKAISTKLVSTNLIDIILMLRNGLLDLDISPIGDINDWKYQNDVIYDCSLHRILVQNENVSQKVRLKTLGFKYYDDDGVWQQHKAQVSTEKINMYQVKVEKEESTINQS